MLEQQAMLRTKQVKYHPETIALEREQRPINNAPSSCVNQQDLITVSSRIDRVNLSQDSAFCLVGSKNIQQC